MSTSTVSALDFTDRRVLVTGGGRGIGKAIALKFLELKATVIVLDKDEQLLSQLTSEYPTIRTVSVDLSDWEATRAAVKSVLPIHHLANNAGIAAAVPFLKVDKIHIDTIFDVNFKAALNVAQVVAQGMIDHEIKDGTIVNTSSVADATVTLGFAIYSATKAALTMITKTMAVELAPHGIRVNCVRPGFVLTEIVKSLPDDLRDKMIKPFLDKQVFHKPIEPEQIADAFVFLSSPLSKSVTGTSLAVDQAYGVQ